jgi:hypothetical protein
MFVVNHFLNLSKYQQAISFQQIEEAIFSYPLKSVQVKIERF